MSSGTDGGNSDTGVLADLADYEEDAQYTPEMLEEIRRINEMGFRSDEDREHSEFVNRPVTGLVTAQPESNINFPSEEDSEFFGRPVTEPVTSWAGSDTDLPSDEHSEFFGQPVTNLMTAWVGSNTDHPSGEQLKYSN